MEKFPKYKTNSGKTANCAEKVVNKFSFQPKTDWFSTGIFINF